MNKNLLFTITALASLFGFIHLCVFSQSNRSIASKPSISAPANIRLPDGYIYQRRQGIDSFVGKIVRKDGFTITHDIGGLAGNYAEEYFPEHFEKLRKRTQTQPTLNPQAIEWTIRSLDSKVEWRQRQKINGDDLMLVRLKDSTLIASFIKSNANFIAKADSSDKIADFLLIVLTYKPDLDKRK